MNSRGQAFEGFNLLIGAIVAFAILTIIVGAIYYFDSLKSGISARRIADGLNNAIQSPTGEVVVVKDVRIEKDELFSKRGLSTATGLPEECFSFQVAQGLESMVSFSPSRFNASALQFNSGLQASVYFRCSQSLSPSACPRMECVVSFGRPPQ